MEENLEKYYTNNEILMEFNMLNDKQTVSVLYDALNYMEEYNGRSKFTCIAMALGYKNTEGEADKWQKNN
jgi:hypothetical protein